jgi:hypothetical protein
MHQLRLLDCFTAKQSGEGWKSFAKIAANLARLPGGYLPSRTLPSPGLDAIRKKNLAWKGNKNS